MAVWEADGTLSAVVVGDQLGALRTGALGAVAADVLANPDAGTVAVIGSGSQAWTQLWALQAVRSLREVRVYSRTKENRDAFSDRARRDLGLHATAVGTAQEAVAGADLVIVATRSSIPVVDADAIEPSAHVVTVGPKFAQAHELPPELADRTSVITSDSPVQAASYPEPYFIGTDRLIDLGAVIACQARRRTSRDDITLHCSVGLAGTDVVLAQQLLATAL